MSIIKMWNKQKLSKGAEDLYADLNTNTTYVCGAAQLLDVVGKN